jgi:hypothetical protein
MAWPPSSSDFSSFETLRGTLCNHISNLEARLSGRIGDVEASLQRQRHSLDGRIYELERGLARMQVLQDATRTALGDERMELVVRHVDHLENELKNSRMLGGKLLGQLTQQVARLDSEVTGVQRIHEIPDHLVLDEECLKRRMDALESSLGEAFSRIGMPVAAGETCSVESAEHQQDLQTVVEPPETMKGGNHQHENEAALGQPRVSSEVSQVDECVARLRKIAAGMRSSHDEGKDAMDKLTKSSGDDTGKFAHLPAKVAAIVASAPKAESPCARNTALAVQSDEAEPLQEKSRTWALSARPVSTDSADVPAPRDEAGVAHSWLHAASMLAATPKRQLVVSDRPGQEDGQVRTLPPRSLSKSVADLDRTATHERAFSTRSPPISVEGPRVLPRLQQQQ